MTKSFELITAGKLTVATGADLPPYSFMNELGQLDGFEIRVMREVARRLGLVYEPVVMPWADILKGLRNKTFDMSSVSMDITPERQLEFDFCDGWVASSAVMLARSEDAPLTEAELGSLGCGVLGNSTWVSLAKARYEENLKVYASNSIAVKALLNREVGLVITDELYADYLTRNPESGLVRLGKPLVSFQKGWALAKGNPHLVQAVNSALAIMIEEGVFQAIAEPFLGYSPHPKQPIRSCA